MLDVSTPTTFRGEKMATTTAPFILGLHEIRKTDIPLAGGKGANLGELIHAGIPVPPGFVVTAPAYQHFIEIRGLSNIIHGMLDGLDPDNSEKLQLAGDMIKTEILKADMPDGIAKQIVSAYKKMGAPLVAVRSSATAEDLPEASFAGQQSTYLNVLGEEEVLIAVKSCWASLFESRAIFYRAHQQYDHLSVSIAVPVQKMVQSVVSGVLFTVEPVTGDRSKIVIDAVYGLGEAAVSGAVTPDYYVVNKSTLAIEEKTIAKQEWKLVRNPDGKDPLDANIRLDVPEAEQEKQKLPDEQILELAAIGKNIEQYHERPQDIEWALEGSELYIVQARPVTALAQPPGLGKDDAVKGKILLSGSPASPGADYGPVKIIFNASEIGLVEDGDVLVTTMTTPDFVPAMKRASAIVTDRGGRTAHAAIVSRELGIPCIVGAETATRVLRPKQIVTVDGTWGKVLEGAVVPKRDKSKEVAIRSRIKTRTNLYVNLAEPDLADVVATRDVDGVGLLRAEFIVARIKEQPKYAIKHGIHE